MNNCTLRTHDSLYLSDGNLAIIASYATRKRVVFRVHQSVLSKHSPVFKTMLELAPPGTDANEMYDGAPLVVLPDPAEAVESLLRILYLES